LILDEEKYYLYRHVRLDKNEPFYIGIASKILLYNKFIKKETEYRRAYDKINRNRFWKNVINITDYKVEILLESDNYDFIKEKEKEFISFYKRRSEGGPLVNLTLGGEGTLGLIVSEKNKRKLSILKKKNPFHCTSIEKQKIKVIEYDLEGNFIKIWDSLSDAARDANCKTGHISKCCKLQIHKIKERRFRYFEKNYKIQIESIGGNNKVIYQYSALTGELIKIWTSTQKASEFLGIENYRLQHCIKNEFLIQNFVFSHRKEEKIYLDNLKPYKSRKSRIKPTK
jgi:hypothetical protein